jgi:hypothetical protein
MNVIRLLPAFLLGLVLSAPAVRIYAAQQENAPKPHSSPRSSSAAIELFAPRVRRSTQTYLRLRLLELREEDLDRARAAIERRLSVDELLMGAGGGRQPLDPANSVRKSGP